jgi:general secretion pathway protein D
MVSVLLGSCQETKNLMQMDRSASLERQDYRDALKPVPPPVTEGSQPPEFQPVLATPQELRLPQPLVTVKVNSTIGLRDLIYQLAEQVGVDVEIDPQIHGSIIFTAQNRPFDEVVQRICDMANLRYSYTNNVLNVKIDRPYLKTYPVGFLNVKRSGDSKIAVTSSSSGGNAANKIDPDLWKELNDGLKQVLLASDYNATNSLATMADPVPQPVNPAPPPAPVSADPNNPAPPPAPGSPQVAPMPAAATPQLNITSPPGEPFQANPASTFAISQETGNVTVWTTDRQQKLVKKFLDEFSRRVTTQVLIEAKVLSVQLQDEFASGVDWSKVGGGASKNPQGGDIDFLPAPATATAAAGIFNVKLSHLLGTDFALTIQALQQFGTVRTLSSPRVTVMNNEPAIVNVTQDNVYFNFTASVTPASATSAATIAINSSQKNAPDGIILVVIPTANPDTGQITMAVRPTVSNVLKFITDPTIGLTLAVNGVTAPAGLTNNQIPELSVQEIDSQLTMQSGEMMALGGLMKDSNTVTQNNVPIAGELPFIGALFRNHADNVVKTELVILIKANVIAGSNIDDTERKTFKVFSLDRHPGNL